MLHLATQFLENPASNQTNKPYQKHNLPGVGNKHKHNRLAGGKNVKEFPNKLYSVFLFIFVSACCEREAAGCWKVCGAAWCRGGQSCGAISP